MTITVSGRPVAQLGPAARRQWVDAAELTNVFVTPAPRTLAKDLRKFPASVKDPFA